MNYPALLREIIGRIRQGQVRAAVSVNVELLALYWDVGRMIAQRQNEEGWGAAVIPRLANDIKNDLTDTKGFSERNLKRMLAFYKEYSDLEIVPRAVAQIDMKNDTVIVPRPVAQLPEAASANLLEYIIRLPWAQNVILLQIKDRKERLWYMRQSLENGWSRDYLSDQIKFDLYNCQSKAVSNFDLRLPEPQSSLAKETLKNPYVFDFLTLDTTFHEKELEDALIADVETIIQTNQRHWGGSHISATDLNETLIAGLHKQIAEITKEKEQAFNDLKGARGRLGKAEKQLAECETHMGILVRLASVVKEPQPPQKVSQKEIKEKYLAIGNTLGVDVVPPKYVDIFRNSMPTQYINQGGAPNQGEKSE